jgi:NAD(P)-dependent dehydrogenase (short-subunit alcohol dehydrogenase family)
MSQSAESQASKAVLITGASTGIGRRTTERLAAKGTFVYAAARKQEDLEGLAAIKGVQPIRLDVTADADIAAAVETISRDPRGLYGLVNNAGVATGGAIADMSLAEFDLIMNVNAYGPVRMVKALGPLIVAQQGRIVNIGSISGVLAGPNLAAYAMSKHAIEALTDSLAAQLAPLGVHVSVVEPGNYNSNITKNAVARMGRDSQLVKSLGWAEAPTSYPEPDDIAAAVEEALFARGPKRRYMIVPTSEQAERTIRKQIEQLIQLNECHAYRYDRAALVKMLDEALAVAEAETT